MVVLADTSAWIEHLKGRSSDCAKTVEDASRLDDLVVGDIILTEILQGIREEATFQAVRRLLSRFRVVSLCGPEIAERAAVNYRALRRRGLTIRGTIDVIIATWCVVHEVPIIHNDRDLAAMEGPLGLVAYRRPAGS